VTAADTRELTHKRLTIVDFNQQPQAGNDAVPILLLHGGSPSERQILIRQLSSMSVGFRLVELSAMDPSHSGGDACDAAKFLEEFSTRMLSVTKKDQEVLQCVLEGRTNKSIAMHLDLSERAIELRKASLMKKLRARSHTELVRLITRFDTLKQYITEQSSNAPIQSESQCAFVPAVPALSSVSD